MIAARHVRTGIAAFTAWWLKELHASLPDALRVLREPARPMRLVVRTDDEDVVVSLIGRSGEDIFVESVAWASYERTFLDRCFAKAVAYGRRRDIALALCIPQSITRSLIIPRRARSTARDIVREHVGRKTPLRFDEIFIGVDLRPAGENKLELRYLVLPKTLLDRTLARLGIEPSELAVLQGRTIGDAQPVIVALAEEQAGGRPLARWALLAFLTLSVLAATTGLGATVWRQHEAIAALDETLSQAAPLAKQSTERFNSVHALAEDVRAYTDLRAAPGAVQVWEELARILPVSTYLTEVDIRGSEVHVTGFSGSASDLIQIIERSSVLHNASFTGRVAFDRARGKEQFALRASLRMSRVPSGERE